MALVDDMLSILGANHARLRRGRIRRHSACHCAAGNADFVGERAVGKGRLHFLSLIQPDDPGVAVLAKKDGNVLFEQGYGVRDLHSRAQIDPQTNFRLACVTKQFTAMAIMLLVHDGKLRYDERLTDVFPDFPAYGKTITIRNLLTHTGGLPDYEELMEREERHGGASWTAEHQIQDEEVLALLKAEPAGLFAPGTHWAYSNSGYVVLGLIVAKVSGTPYREFMLRRIFEPLKMNETLVYEKGKNAISRRAFGHSKEDDKLVETDQSSTSATLGDGGMYSTWRIWPSGTRVWRNTRSSAKTRCGRPSLR